MKDECWKCGDPVDTDIAPVYRVIILSGNQQGVIHQSCSKCSKLPYDPTWAEDKLDEVLDDLPH